MTTFISIDIFSKKDSCPRSIADELGFDGHRDLAKYMTVKGYLWDDEGVLRQLLDGKDKIESEGNIPRYAVPGIFVTKSVHMTNHLDQLVRDFSKEKNISQRELFEVALVGMFQKYGYMDEIETLLELG